MSDIEKSFTFLHDSIPQWLKNVADIEEKIVAMQDELAKVPMASRTLPKKRKSESVESIRGLDVVMEEPGMAAADQPNPLAPRKRKSPSISSEQASTAVKVRARSMIVVSYDGQLQNSFEQLVRAIGTGRNLLRKGKMAAKMEAMAALADDDEDSDDDNAVLSKIGYRHRTGFPSMRTPSAISRNAAAAAAAATTADSSSTPSEVFDSVDKALESAQSLCERAAHQSLREGDCRKELGTVREHFTEVQGAASKEVARIVAKKEREAQEAPKAVKEEPETEAMLMPPLEEKRLHPVPVPTTATSTRVLSQVMHIEVDDEDDDEDMDFVMPPIRLTSRV